MKVGLFRDDTAWLDENHSLEFYKLQDGVCFPFPTDDLSCNLPSLRTLSCSKSKTCTFPEHRECEC